MKIAKTDYPENYYGFFNRNRAKSLKNEKSEIFPNKYIIYM